MSAAAAPTVAPTVRRGKSAQVRIQKFGTFLTGMIMPNLPAFLAWGLITSFFIAAGWTPNGIIGGFANADTSSWQGAATALAKAADGTTFHQYLGLVGPMVTYLLPLLIANAGGRIVYGARGAVVASIATVGVIVGSTVPMFLGAMVVGPLAAWLMKQVDRIWDGKIRPGFEMLVNNFSAGILGALLAVGAFFGVAPVVEGFSNILKGAVQWLISAHLLPLTSIFIEPGKVLFLNNAINHGILTPLGIQQSEAQGKSILFLLEANPWGFICHDGGMSKNRSGISGLVTADEAGLAGACIDGTTAPIGDAFAGYEYGLISAHNDAAARRGVAVGMTVKEAAHRLLVAES